MSIEKFTDAEIELLAKDYFKSSVLGESGNYPYERAIESAVAARYQAEIDRLKADAERYRLLRKYASGGREKDGKQYFCVLVPPPLGDIMKGGVAQHLDAAIDAAIEKEQK